MMKSGTEYVHPGVIDKPQEEEIEKQNHESGSQIREPLI